MSQRGNEFQQYPERFSGEPHSEPPDLLVGWPPRSFDVKETREEIHNRLTQQEAETANFLVYNKPYERAPGTTSLAPYVNVSISGLTDPESSGINFKARIDTGADISCIPKSQAKKLMPLLQGRLVLPRAHDGTRKTARTYLVIISIHSHPDDDQIKSYRPERGVLLTTADVGLIGMDIISNNWKVIFDGFSQKFSVECI